MTAAFPNGHLTSSIRVGGSAVDALIVDQEAKTGYVVNLKYSRSSFGKNLRNRLEESVSLASASVRLSNSYGYEVQPVLMMVIADDVAVPSRREVQDQMDSVGAAFSVRVLVILVNESSFADISTQAFRELLAGRLASR